MIWGGYYVITGVLSGLVLLASVPYGLGVASILVGKHIDQRGFDTSQHQRTLPVLLGETRARRLNQAVVVGHVRLRGRRHRGRRVEPAGGGGRRRRAEGPARAAGHERAGAGRATGRLRRLAALVPPGLPGPQPVVRLAVHRRAGRRSDLPGVAGRDDGILRSRTVRHGAGLATVPTNARWPNCAAGAKTSHWMWFVFPQIAGLGYSAMSQRYAIASLAEARAYLAHPVLGRGCASAPRLVAVTPGQHRRGRSSAASTPRNCIRR